MDANLRKQIQVAYLEELKITSRVFELVDTYIDMRTEPVPDWRRRTKHAPDWLRSIAALSFRLGVQHEAIQDAVKAGQQDDWDTVDLVLMAYEL